LYKIAKQSTVEKPSHFTYNIVLDCTETMLLSLCFPSHPNPTSGNNKCGLSPTVLVINRTRDFQGKPSSMWFCQSELHNKISINNLYNSNALLQRMYSQCCYRIKVKNFYSELIKFDMSTASDSSNFKLTFYLLPHLCKRTVVSLCKTSCCLSWARPLSLVSPYLEAISSIHNSRMCHVMIRNPLNMD
jgi:hypothetical protein